MKKEKYSNELNGSSSQVNPTWLQELILGDLRRGTSATFIHIGQGAKSCLPRETDKARQVVGARISKQ